MNFLPFTPFYLYLLLALGLFLLLKSYWYLLTDEQRFLLQTRDVALLRDFALVSPFFLIFLTMMENLSLARVILLVLSLLIFIVNIKYLQDDINYYKQHNFSKNARLLRAGAVIVLLLTFMLFVYHLYVRLPQKVPMPPPEFLGNTFLFVLWAIIFGNKERAIKHVLNDADRRIMYELEHNEKRSLRLLTAFALFGILLSMILLLSTFNNAGTLFSVILLVVFATLFIGTIVFSYLKERELYRLNELPKEFLIAHKNLELSRDLSFIVVIILQILLKRFIF